MSFCRPTAAALVRHRSDRAFTLVELLVVIGLIAALIAVLLPTLGKARREASRAKCLANMRSMAVAQGIYAAENRGYLIQVGFGHGGEATKDDIAWFYVLQRYGSNALLPRCPSDTSPYWQDDGIPYSVTAGVPKYRLTSYGVNDFLDRFLCPWGPGFNAVAPPSGWYTKMSQIRRSSATIQFFEMSYAGEFACADHAHIENWGALGRPTNPATPVLQGMQINAHDKRLPYSFKSVANYSFLDGHAESLPFGDVFRSFNQNRFDPAIAQ